jgi:hypothetical protein
MRINRSSEGTNRSCNSSTSLTVSVIASRKDGSMDSESEIQFLKNRVAALEKDARELDAGLRWVMDELRKKKLLPPRV